MMKRTDRPVIREEPTGYSGPRDMLEVGSPEWCRRTVIRLKTLWAGVEGDWQRFEEALAEVEGARLYTLWPPGQPYGSMAELLQAELGATPQQVAAKVVSAKANERVRDAAMATDGDVLPPGRPMKEHANLARLSDRASSQGVSRDTQRKLDRIARQSPALLAQVQQGVISVSTAYHQATGKPPQVSVTASVEGFARAARKHLPGQLDALVEALRCNPNN